jgi:hypothetical protein
MADTLQTPYSDLFNMANKSPLYAGLDLSNGNAIKVDPNKLQILNNNERATADLSIIKKISDLKTFGITDFASANIENAFLENGKLNLKLDVPALNKTITNISLTPEIFNITVGITGLENTGVSWTPTASHWQDMGDFERDVNQFNDPIQGALGDCWLIAALAAVSWSMPTAIDHRTRPTSTVQTDHVNQLTFYSKGFGRDAPTATMEVTDNIVVTKTNNQVVYCNTPDPGEFWPAIYEKAFAKWTTKNTTDQPNIASLSGGDPALATAQLTNRKPTYYDTSSRSGEDLWGIVRSNSLSYRTFNPLTAWTYASGNQYNGSNIAANHAYTILGWAFQNNKQYIVLRNPWGFSEPSGANTYQGLLQFFDQSFWRPINIIGDDGVFALEADAFKLYYSTIGAALP